MTKEQVRDQMFAAKTLPECRAAWRAQEAYLEDCPDEWEDFLDAGETLAMTEEALAKSESQRVRELARAS